MDTKVTIPFIVTNYELQSSYVVAHVQGQKNKTTVNIIRAEYERVMLEVGETSAEYWEKSLSIEASPILEHLQAFLVRDEHAKYTVLAQLDFQYLIEELMRVVPMNYSERQAIAQRVIDYGTNKAEAMKHLVQSLFKPQAA